MNAIADNLMNIHYNTMSHQHVCLIALGMAGTGKTTLVGNLQEMGDREVCMINLDPAVKVLPYTPFIDIRETHDYRKVMKEFKLGPNGAILTALNLYAAQPQTIVDKIKEKLKSNDKRKVFIIDIPGQIQVFTWSSSSTILTAAISTLMPVKLLYVLDSQRCQNPNAFLSNLLFAQSIQCRMEKYPFLLLFNKCDCSETDKLVLWITDYDEFLNALQEDQTYLATLSRSLIINLSQFYETLERAVISAKKKIGFESITNFMDNIEQQE